MKADEQRDIHISIGDHVGADKVGEDKLALRSVSGDGVAIGRRATAGDGGRRRMEDYDVVIALNELRNQIFAMHGRLASLETQVAHLNERLRPSPLTFGTGQWLIIAVVVAVAMLAAIYVSAAQ